MLLIQNLKYSEDDMLLLSGIQHYVFCPRQWALIYLEQQWEENFLTTEGHLLHNNVDNPFIRETNGSDIIILRGIRLESKILGLTGIADAIEIIPHSDAPRGKQAVLRSKKYDAIPIEYKRGKRKLSDCDRIQVASQAMIIEEMFDIKIEKGAIFYWQERHREYFDISETMRTNVSQYSEAMHELLRNRRIPAAKRQKNCRSCSLVDICMPGLNKMNVSEYLNRHFNEETT